MMDETDAPTMYKLEIENELRILVDDQPSSAEVELTSGIAEIFGTEMEINKKYIFPPRSSISIFTWYGCTVKVTGKTHTYVATDTYMILNTILHAYLEERRILAESEKSVGPITLVVGPTDVGKTSLCRFILNCAARMGRRPLLVDLDVGQNSISVPGSMGILSVEKPADVVEGFAGESSLVFHFGYKSPGHNIPLYFLLLKKLGEVVRQGLRQARRSVKASGVVINTCGWVRGWGYNAITFAALVFEINTLCVIEEERLYRQLKNDIPSNVNIHYIPKMQGVIERSRMCRFQTRDLRVREYFYGTTNQLTPYTFEVNFADLKIFSVQSKQVPDGFDTTNITMHDFVNLQQIDLRTQLVGHILGISSAQDVSDDMILKDVLGFACIRHVDLRRSVITVLSPQPGPLPSSILFFSEIRMSDFAN